MHPHFNLFQFRHFKFQFPRVGTKKQGFVVKFVGFLRWWPARCKVWYQRGWHLDWRGGDASLHSLRNDERQLVGCAINTHAEGPIAGCFFLMENPKNNGGFTGTTILRNLHVGNKIQWIWGTMWIIIDESLLMIWNWVSHIPRWWSTSEFVNNVTGNPMPYTYLTGDRLYHP